MYYIGLTGSIASGKSTVAALFKKIGIDVISADQIARSLVCRNQPALQQIIKHFGNSVLTHEGELNRRHLRELIVSNPVERRWLENLLHPLIREKIKLDTERCTSSFCLIEIPLLTTKSDYPYINRILLVLADPELQILRIMARDHCTENQARAILTTTRADDDKRRLIANDVIRNDGAIDSLQKQVDSLHAQYLDAAKVCNP